MFKSKAKPLVSFPHLFCYYCDLVLKLCYTNCFGLEICHVFATCLFKSVVWGNIINYNLHVVATFCLHCSPNVSLYHIEQNDFFCGMGREICGKFAWSITNTRLLIEKFSVEWLGLSREILFKVHWCTYHHIGICTPWKNWTTGHLHIVY